MMGISLLLIERDRPGVSTRAMDCMGAKGSGTAYVEFEDVRVPQDNLIGDISCLLKNFVTERLGIAFQANRFARICLSDSIEWIRILGLGLTLTVSLGSPCPTSPNSCLAQAVL